MKPIHQSCQNCCFAENDHGNLSETIMVGDRPMDHVIERPTQTGCRASYLDKFRQKGENVVLEAENEQGEFYVIDGYKCPAYRIWEVADLEKLRSQLKLKIDAFFKKHDIKIKYLLGE